MRRKGEDGEITEKIFKIVVRCRKEDICQDI